MVLYTIMSTAQAHPTKRFTLPQAEESDIYTAIESMLESSHLALLEEMGSWEWEVKTLNIEEITCDEDMRPRRNAALQERSQATAKAQLMMGMAPPLVVIEENNLLIDGYSRYTLLEEFNDAEVTVFHGTITEA
jgi:hypothetical protein